MIIKMKLILIALCIFISGCASWDGQLTKLHPLRQQNGQQVYLFTTSANFAYPLESKEAEQIRINWLKRKLRDHGLDDEDYTVLERRVVEAEGGVIGGKGYHIYYEVLTKRV
jgi:hypothetical protein